MLEELKNKIERGADIEFRYMDEDYTILGWLEEGVAVGRHGADEDFIFKDADDLMENYVIHGKRFKDIVEDIEILFSS